MELAITLTPYKGLLLACAKLGDAVVGAADYDPGGHFFSNVWTHRQARGRGVATAIYNAVEAKGLKVIPSETLTADGMSFWRNRGIDPTRFGSRQVPGGSGADDEVFGSRDVSVEVEAWDEARASVGPRP